VHDPMVVLFEVRRPWPRVYRTRHRPKNRWRFRLPFVRVGRVEAYWPAAVTVWHVEPGGADSGKVCGHHPQGARKLQWAWRHRSHLKLQVHAWQKICRRIWTRCAHCGKPFRGDNRMVISHSWGGPGPGWRVREKVLHDKCSSILGLQRQLAEAREAITLAGVDSLSLELAGMDSTKAWRILYERDRALEMEQRQAAQTTG
jgi:hypothetical protein